MEVRAVSKYIRMSPRKARTVVGMIVGKPVQEAVQIADLSEKKASFLIGKTLKSAIANAKNNLKLSVNEMRVKEAIIEVGPTQRRYRYAARGRVHPIKKRMCHIKVTLTDGKVV